MRMVIKKDKEKTVEEKERSRMEIALNAFKRGSRERGTGADSIQTPNTTQSKLQLLSTTLN
jgi:hypothetical protein